MDRIATLPRINWPVESGAYKLLQLEIGTEPYLRFARQHDSLHRKILTELATVVRKQCPLQRQVVDSVEYFIPAPTADWYRVVGAGWAKVDHASRVALFHWNSADYGMGIDETHLQRMEPYATGWRLQRTFFPFR